MQIIFDKTTKKVTKLEQDDYTIQVGEGGLKYQSTKLNTLPMIDYYYADWLKVVDDELLVKTIEERYNDDSLHLPKSNDYYVFDFDNNSYQELRNVPSFPWNIESTRWNLRRS